MLPARSVSASRKEARLTQLAVGVIKPKKEGDAAPVHAVAVSADGYALRFNLDPFLEPSTRSGRRFARPSKGSEIVGVARLAGGEILITATAEGRGLLAKADPFTERIMKGSQELYRARFAGFDQDGAEAACKYFKRNEIACMAIKN